MSDAPASQPPQDGRVTLGNGETFQLASQANMRLASIIDGVLLGLLVGFIWMMNLVSSLSSTGSELPLFTGMILVFFSAGICVLYPFIMITSKGWTLGMKLARIKIVRAEDGLYPNWQQLFRTFKELVAHGFRIFSLSYNVRSHENTKFFNECDVKIIQLPWGKNH